MMTEVRTFMSAQATMGTGTKSVNLEHTIPTVLPFFMLYYCVYCWIRQAEAHEDPRATQYCGWTHLRMTRDAGCKVPSPLFICMVTWTGHLVVGDVLVCVWWWWGAGEVRGKGKNPPLQKHWVLFLDQSQGLYISCEVAWLCLLFGCSTTMLPRPPNPPGQSPSSRRSRSRRQCL